MSLIKLATIKINNTYLWHVSICLHVYINNNIRIIPMNTVIMFRNSGNAHLINPVCPIDNGKQSCDNGGQAVWYQNYIKDIFSVRPTFQEFIWEATRSLVMLNQSQAFRSSTKYFEKNRSEIKCEILIRAERLTSFNYSNFLIDYK